MKNINERYNLNKSAKVGTLLKCPSCGTKFTKHSYQQVFCKTKGGTKCKDKYWNTTDPDKRNNKDRISEPRKIWLTDKSNYKKEMKKYRFRKLFDKL